MEARFAEEMVVGWFITPKLKLRLTDVEARLGWIKDEVRERGMVPKHLIVLGIEHGVEFVDNGLCDFIIIVHNECSNGGGGCAFSCT